MTWLVILLAAFTPPDQYQFTYQHLVQPVCERVVVDRYDATRFRLIRTYGATCPAAPVRACPRTVDWFEWRTGTLYYLGTDNWYTKRRVRYTPGHRWLTTTERANYATHAWTTGTAWRLEDTNGDCVEEAAILVPEDGGTHDIWHAAYPGQQVTSPLTGPVEAVRLDEVTVVNGNWATYWKEEWWIAPTIYGPAPVRHRGWYTDQLLWDMLLVGVDW